jgi:hypothetical protein
LKRHWHKKIFKTFLRLFCKRIQALLQKKPATEKFMAYLSLCCVAKDEDRFIGEWLTYHALLGVEHFYIYDNESARPLREHPTVARYMQNGRATVQVMPGRAVQYEAYAHCLRNYSGKTRWMGFLDVDEFICLKADGKWLDFRPLLAEFESYGCLALNWLTMTSSGHEHQPGGPVIANYSQTAAKSVPLDLHVKSFVRPELVVRMINPHSFELREGSFAVNEKHQPMTANWPFTPPYHERAWINHYYFKSREDFERKIARGRADIGKQRGPDSFLEFEKQTEWPVRQENCAASLAALVEKYADSMPPGVPEPEPGKGLKGYIDLAEQIVNDSSQDLTADFYAGCDLSKMEKLNRAEAVLCKAAEFHAQSVQLWIMRAYLARHQRHFKQSEQFLNKAMTIEEHPASYEELFHLALARGNKNEAGSILLYLKNLPYKNETAPGLSERVSVYEKMIK